MTNVIDLARHRRARAKAAIKAERAALRADTTALLADSKAGLAAAKAQAVEMQDRLLDLARRLPQASDIQWAAETEVARWSELDALMSGQDPCATRRWAAALFDDHEPTNVWGQG